MGRGGMAFWDKSAIQLEVLTVLLTELIRGWLLFLRGRKWVLDLIR